MTTTITLRPGADAAGVRARLAALGLWVAPCVGRGGDTVAFTAAASSQAVPAHVLVDVPGVADVLAPASPHPRLDAQSGRPVVLQRGDLRVAIGGGLAPVLAAGPCSAESPEQVHRIAALAAAAGARLLRGGAYKPRTSPYAFDGHGPVALGWLREAADAHGLLLVTEVLSEADAEAVADAADLLQVGSRNMQNFALLRAIGRTGRPVLLKRGMAASLAELRASAEHLLVAGAADVVLCERGILGADPETRNTLDLGGAALLIHVDGLPVIVDPSHAAGRRDLVVPLSRAALAVGASGLLIEVHDEPGAALSDGPQALLPAGLDQVAALFAARGVAR